ncbi:nucleotidyltransferase family protein [Tsuneonella troitsensis]|uniref:nucleotidyltransferase family protein n=1 Tax=Tsuneonella troitsensis TaxID=292222 RepID=UPI00070E82DB|nr:nucleotidyltransferase domain-containing protein [Tsuneonella troitsensis]
MPSVEQLLEALADWGQQAVKSLGADGVYAFGSLVYLRGEQLTPTSDIDIAVRLPSSLTDAVSRAEWLETFFSHKAALELKLLQVLERQVIEEPFASVIPVTQLEVELDLHKQNLPEFYSANQFLDLASQKVEDGLAGAASKPCHRFAAGSISMTQGIRHSFLGVAANTRRSLEPFDGVDPIPKPIMRAAAMARRLTEPTAPPGAEYDLRLGLDHVSQFLLSHESSSARLKTLSMLVSERRGGRGHGGPLSDADQLLLAEIVYDLAATAVESAGSPPGDTSSNGTKSAPRLPEPVGRDDGMAMMHFRQHPPAGTGSKPEPAGTGSKPDGETRTDGEVVDMPAAKRPLFGDQTSLVFFHDRFMQAFPGTREISWFDKPEDIIERLCRLLNEPIKFADASPIWWWRGGNFQIERFERLDADMALMNYEELKISRAAAVPGPSYKWNFVYIETEAMAPTGLYDYSEYSIEERAGDRSYVSEEYGLVNGEHHITRAEYDDGGAYIGGSYVNTVGQAALRVRYITPYNFVIAPQASPINNAAFDRELVALLDSALAGERETVISKLAEEVARLPLRREW